MQLLPTQHMDEHTIFLSRSHNWHWSPINFPALVSTILQTVMPSSVDQPEQHELNLMRHVEWRLRLSTFCQIPRVLDNRALILSAATAGIGNTCFLAPIVFLFHQESRRRFYLFTCIISQRSRVDAHWDISHPIRHSCRIAILAFKKCLEDCVKCSQFTASYKNTQM